MAKKTKSDFLDEAGRLRRTALVRFQRTFYDGAVQYRVTRFGTQVPAGVLLPKDAEILGEPELPPEPVSDEPTLSL